LPQKTWFPLAVASRGPLEEAQRASQLDPRSAYIAATVVLRLGALGRCQEAVAQGRKALQLDPNLWMAHSFTAGAMWSCGQREQAITEWESALALPGVYERWVLSQLVVAYAKVGRQADALKAFDRLRELPDVEPQRLAAAYAGLGRKQEAIRVLQTARGRANLKADPLPELLGNEPAYQALLREDAMRKQRDSGGEVSPRPRN
jgi:tetratricopeptide (TPR) repeat protein